MASDVAAGARLPEAEYQRHRSVLREDARYQFVDPEEYCRLAVSTRKLIRFYEAAALVRGLFDPAMRLHFVVEDERLICYQACS